MDNYLAHWMQIYMKLTNAKCFYINLVEIAITEVLHHLNWILIIQNTMTIKNSDFANVDRHLFHYAFCKITHSVYGVIHIKLNSDSYVV